MAKVKKVKEGRLEDILFECRDNLRGKASIGDKRDLMLTLVFLKFMNDRYDEQVEKVMAEAKGNEKLAKILLSRPASFGKRRSCSSGRQRIRRSSPSSERAHNDPEAQSVLEECREALEKEDIAYLAQNSPNPYERAFYRKRLY